MKRPLLILASFLGLAFSPARADYHYASHTGSNEYPYTSWQTAADSITGAFQAADPYDTIYIASGDYNELVRMAVGDSCLTLIGAGVDSTRAWSSISGHLWEVSDKTVVQDIWFDQTSDWACYYAHFFESSIIARDCKFTNRATGAFHGVAISGAGDSTVAENCEFYGVDEVINLAYTGKLVFGNNLVRSPVTDVVILGDFSWGIIENNVVITSSRGTLFLEPRISVDSLLFANNYVDNIWSGPDIYDPLRLNVSNNTVRKAGVSPPYFSEAFRIWMDFRQPNSGFIYNNAITESGEAIEARFGSLPQNRLHIHHNDFWGNTQGNFQIDNWANVDTFANIYDFPMYANPDSFDVHLQAYSPLIDAGDPNILDLDGTRSDIGCYGGPGGCSYTYLDLAPLIPDSLQGRVDSNMVILTWRYNYEADFNRYQIFRDTVSGFQPSVFNMITEPETSYYEDGNINPGVPYYYRFMAVDNQGNISDHSEELAVIPVSVPGFFTDNLPEYTVITSAYPNPFNSNATIVYSASNLGPQPPEVSLKIFDVGGRVVRTLFDGHKPAGTYRAIWDGKDDAGNPISSGTYFARVSQWGMGGGDFPIKITLIK